MKKSRWFEPYTTHKQKQVCSIRDCWTCGSSGVYFIRNKRSQKICYIGQSQSQLKKTIYRHFQQWTDKQQSSNKNFDRKTYPKQGFEIRFIKCSPSKALKLEAYLINKLQPKDNPLKYNNLTTAEKNAGAQLLDEHNQAKTLTKNSYWVGMEDDLPF